MPGVLTFCILLLLMYSWPLMHHPLFVSTLSYAETLQGDRENQSNIAATKDEVGARL